MLVEDVNLRMKNFRSIVNDDQLRAVNGGANIDFEKIGKSADKINADKEKVTLGWHWGDDWSADPYWG